VKKLLVTGAGGLLGKAICTVAQNDFDVISLKREDCDLINFQDTKAIFNYVKPDYVIHTAAVVGGIGSNMNHPGKFFCSNIAINTNILECARLVNVKKLISFLSTCVFPDNAPYPLSVENIHDGPPHPSNAAYAHAKRMLDVQSRAYRTEYGCDFITLVPTNLYGFHDNWDIENGHVIPSLIHKAFIAKKEEKPLIVWGSGKPLREFIFVDDMANISLRCFSEYISADPLIISTSEEVSVGKVAEKIAKRVGVKCIFDTDKPDGQMRKPSDNSVFKEIFPDFVFTSLKQGLGHTINEFEYHWINKLPMRGVSYDNK
jgi:GDP-L-fucose synthase